MKTLFATAILFLWAATASSEPISPNRITVVDGDTIKVDLTTSVRLVGFNAPETLRAQTPTELTMGDEATARLEELVRGGDLDLTVVRCACAPGTEGTKFCNFGRMCGILKEKGIDVGATLINEWLAVPYVCGETSCPRAPNPWRNK